MFKACFGTSVVLRSSSLKTTCVNQSLNMMTANHSFKSVIINSNINSVCAINYMVMASASNSSNAHVHGHFGLNGLG